MSDAALWVNDGILLGTAVLVFAYVRATNKLVRTSQQQLESQSQPALVAAERHSKIELVNIGTGPAIEVEWRFKDRGTTPVFTESQEPIETVSFVEELAVHGYRLFVTREMGTPLRVP